MLRWTRPDKNWFPERINQPHITQTGVRHGKVARDIHGQAIRATWPVGRKELTDLCNAAIAHERRTPYTITARDPNVQNFLVRGKYKSVRARDIAEQ